MKFYSKVDPHMDQKDCDRESVRDTNSKMYYTFLWSKLSYFGIDDYHLIKNGSIKGGKYTDHFGVCIT